MQDLKEYLFALLLLPVLSFAQGKDEEVIEWNSSRPLSWSDYKGNPDPHSDAAASTTTYLGIEYEMDENNFSWKIQCRFSITRSWGKTKTDFILKHEQGHFDIAEIFARKLNKKMKEYRFDRENYKTDLRTIYTTITAEKEAFQDLYDSETDHSRKKDIQEQWLKKISRLLEELKDYSGY